MAAKISPERRDRLLDLLRAGHDLEAAAASAGVDLADVRADGELMAACADAYRFGTAWLRKKLLEKALAGGDIHILERAIEARGRAQREFPIAPAPADDGGIDLGTLSDFELELYEAMGGGDFGRARELIAQQARQEAQVQVATLRGELDAARAASEAQQTTAAAAGTIARADAGSLALDDPAEPLGRDRGLVPYEPAPGPAVDLVETAVRRFQRWWRKQAQAWFAERGVDLQEIDDPVPSAAELARLADDLERSGRLPPGAEIVWQNGVPSIWFPADGGWRH